MPGKTAPKTPKRLTKRKIARPRRARVQTRREVLSLLRANRDLLKRCKVKRIGLFGSFARDEQTRKSDVDFLVDFSEPDFDSFMELHEQLRKLCRRKVEIVTPIGLSKYIKPYVEKEVRWHEVE
jgi:predicted nucleotidyltransferase